MAQHPQDWTHWLALVTAVHNNQRNTTTGLLPNQVLLRIEPPLIPKAEIPTRNQLAEDRIGAMKQWRNQATRALQKAAKTPPDFRPMYQTGDRVWLEAMHLKLPYQASKLNPKWYGPFHIEKVISPVAYCLELPNNWWIHNVFHTSLLFPYRETMCYRPNFSWPPPDIIDGVEEPEIEKIIDH
jgi:hypothetical protein